jgi:hypothetical protein
VAKPVAVPPHEHRKRILDVRSTTPAVIVSRVVLEVVLEYAPANGCHFGGHAMRTFHPFRIVRGISTSDTAA